VRYFAASLAAAFLGAAIWLWLDERSRLTLFQPHGYIDSGSVFGVEIGESRLEVRRELESAGFEYQRTELGQVCFFRPTPPESTVDVFFVTSWQGGMVCVVSTSDVVQEIIWAFQPSSL
jgi:hypothetical protein